MTLTLCVPCWKNKHSAMLSLIRPNNKLLFYQFGCEITYPKMSVVQNLAKFEGMSVFERLVSELNISISQ